LKVEVAITITLAQLRLANTTRLSDIGELLLDANNFMFFVDKKRK